MRFALLTLASTAALVVAAVPAARAENAYGLTGQSSIIQFDTTSPDILINTTSVSGFTGSDVRLVDIDFYPVTGQLMGIAPSGNLYRINPTTGAMTLDATPNMTLPGVIAIDFNPMADRLRISAGGNRNYRLTPSVQTTTTPTAGGTVTDDGLYSFAAGDTNAGKDPNIVAAAYTNNFDGATSTSLFTIDSNLDALLLNTGTPQFSTLTTVATLTLGGLRFNVSNGNTGFDVSQSGIAYLSRGPALYSVNLATGALTALGTIDDTNVVSIAVQAVPEPSTYVLTILGSLTVLVGLQRRRSVTA